MPALVHRTRISIDNARLPGWRLRFPIWAAKRRGYCVALEIDAFVDGWWAFWIGLGAEPIGNVRPRQVHGVALRLTWGWAPLAQTK